MHSTIGTAPPHAIVLASSEGHEPEAPWVLVPEERLTHLTTVPGVPADELIRADLTFFETPGNGAVFSTGSITFCGSLLHNACNNNVSRLIRNVLDRFLDRSGRGGVGGAGMESPGGPSRLGSIVPVPVGARLGKTGPTGGAGTSRGGSSVSAAMTVGTIGTARVVGRIAATESGTGTTFVATINR